MEISIPLSNGLILRISDHPQGEYIYETSVLPKGFLLIKDGQDLAEEAVGFGFPVMKRGLQTLFPGSLRLSYQKVETILKVQADYSINLAERIRRQGDEYYRNETFYAIKNFLAALVRHISFLRRPLTSISSGLRNLFSWETSYEDAGYSIDIKVIYTIDERSGKMIVETFAPSPFQEEVTEIVVMNELGANYFDTYTDSSGKSLKGKKIGCWDEVAADEASFKSDDLKIGFTLARIKGTKLFRGRELEGSRLAWAGFGYSFPPSLHDLSYEIKLEKFE
jgi:hypothetical protein